MNRARSGCETVDELAALNCATVSSKIFRICVTDQVKSAHQIEYTCDHPNIALMCLSNLNYYNTVMIVMLRKLEGLIPACKVAEVTYEQKARTPVMIGSPDVPKWRKDSSDA
jgi:hypothetical protein